MEKKPFLTEEQAQEIIQDVPTPFHVYDEKGIRENVRRINKAFSWNKGFREYFAVKALPNPIILQILKEEGCGVDCSSLTELMLSEVCGFTGSDIMFSSNQTPVEDMLDRTETKLSWSKQSKIMEQYDLDLLDALSTRDRNILFYIAGRLRDNPKS